MWFVFILESQDGKNGRQERQGGGLHSHTLSRECIQGLLSQTTNRTQRHHLRNGGITSAVGVLTLPRGAALLVLPHGDPSVAVSTGGSGRAGWQGQVLSMGLARGGVRQLGRCCLAPARVSRTLLSPATALSRQMWDV